MLPVQGAHIENPIFIQKGVINGVVGMGKAPAKAPLFWCQCLLAQSYAQGPTQRPDCLGVTKLDTLICPKSSVVADESHWCPHWEPESGVATLEGFQDQKCSPSFPDLPRCLLLAIHQIHHHCYIPL